MKIDEKEKRGKRKRLLLLRGVGRAEGIGGEARREKKRKKERRKAHFSPHLEINHLQQAPRGALVVLPVSRLESFLTLASLRPSPLTFPPSLLLSSPQQTNSSLKAKVDEKKATK